MRAETRVGALRWDTARARLGGPVRARGDRGSRRCYARRVVLATGIEGSGEWDVPGDDPRRPAALALRAHALGHRLRRARAASASRCWARARRRSTTPRPRSSTARARCACAFAARRWSTSTPTAGPRSSGFCSHLGDLPDADKWRFIRQILRMGQLPPADTFERARRHPGFHLHARLRAGSALERARRHGDHPQRPAANATKPTSSSSAPASSPISRRRPELARVEPHIARWSDRFHAARGRAPRGSRCATPTSAPASSSPSGRRAARPTCAISTTTRSAASLSLGFGGASISGMKYSIPRLVRRHHRLVVRRGSRGALRQPARLRGGGVLMAAARIGGTDCAASAARAWSSTARSAPPQSGLRPTAKDRPRVSPQGTPAEGHDVPGGHPRERRPGRYGQTPPRRDQRPQRVGLSGAEKRVGPPFDSGHRPLGSGVRIHRLAPQSRRRRVVLDVPLAPPRVRHLGARPANIRIEDVRLMGHSSIRVTQEIYVHVSADVYDRFFDATNGAPAGGSGERQ